MIRLYDYFESGNAYKVRLLLSQLGIPFERVEVDILKRETRTRRFVDKNPNHRVPLVEWPDGRTLAESNAILFYFGQGTPYLPDDPWLRAQALQWMFFEQYSHEPYIAVVRFWKFSGRLEENRSQLADRTERGYEALAIMDAYLDGRAFLVGDAYSIADICLYAYTHVAEEGDFDLSRFPAILAWISRVRERPGHVRITDPVGTTVDW